MIKGTGRKLSGSERLQIANRLSGQADAVPGSGSLIGQLAGILVPHVARSYEQKAEAYRRQALRVLARNSFERVVAAVISPKKLLSIENEVAQRFLFRCYFAPQFALLETAVRTKLLITFQCFSEFDTSARSEY